MPAPLGETGGTSWITSAWNRPAAQVAPLLLGAMLIATGVVLLIERARSQGVHVLWPLLLVVIGAARVGSVPDEGQDDAWWLVAVGLWLLAKALAPTLFHQVVAISIVAAGVVTWRRRWNDLYASS